MPEKEVKVEEKYLLIAKNLKAVSCEEKEIILHIKEQGCDEAQAKKIVAMLNQQQVNNSKAEEIFSDIFIKDGNYMINA